MLTLSPSLFAVTSGAAALALALLYIRRPGVAVAVLFPLLSLELRTSVSFGGATVPVSSTIVLVAVLLTTALATGRFATLRRRRFGVLPWLGLFVAVALVSLVGAADPLYGLRKALELAVAVAGYALVLVSVQSLNDARAFLISAAASLALVAVTTVVEVAHTSGQALAQFGHSNVLGAYVALVAPLATVLVWERTRGHARTAALVLTALVAFGILGLSGSRGAFLAFILEAAVMVWFLMELGPRRRYRSWGAALAVLLGVPLSLLVTLAGRPLASLYEPAYVTHVFRLAVWREAVPMFVGHPVLGVGYMNPGLALRETAGILAFHTHNLYLEILSGMGLLGFAVFVGLAVAVRGQVKRLSGHRPGGDGGQAVPAVPFASLVAWAVSAIALGLLAQGFVDFNLWDLRYTAPLAAVLALPSVVRVQSIGAEPPAGGLLDEGA